jgi:chromosome segregation ATPase
VRGQLSELVERESRSGRELQRLRAEQEAQENKVLELEVARDKALAEMQEAELARSKLEKQVGVLKAQVEKLRGEDKAGEFQAQVADLKKRVRWLRARVLPPLERSTHSRRAA